MIQSPSTFDSKTFLNCEKKRGIQIFSSEKEGRPISVLIATDVHGRDRDFSTVRGFVKHFEDNVVQLANIVEREKIDILIMMGDISDCGYIDEMMILSHYNLWRFLASKVKYAATIIGNHMFFERDSNLEFLCVQPHIDYPTVRPYFIDKTVFYNPQAIIVDDVQFSLFNHNKKVKNYVLNKLPSTNFHVGLYHDDSVLPSNIKRDMHIPLQINTGYLAEIYKNINHAVLAHIHSPYPMQKINVSGRWVTMEIPGSLCITENSDTEKHEVVMLPKFVIGNGRIEHSHVKFKVGMDKLTFIKSAAKTSEERKDFSLIDTQLAIRTTDEAVRTYTSTANRKSYIDYLKGKGYTDEALDLVALAINSNLTLEDATEDLINRKEGSFKCLQQGKN